MRLIKIELYGFKSFAERTVLHIDLGITAIVGPNGCGKSNIADAIRWVLGEQSAKSMRGNKMPDVIFAGTNNRKPLNYAEVSITLGDIQGALPIDYDEVTITRRLHRDGESEYFINRNPVRLKDIHLLFLDSGMGKDAYSIFEQGKIDHIIHATALERRTIFEEAAGILRFLQRKRESLRKLELSDQNISRVKDIHQEVEKQIVVLEKQAERARQFKDSRAKLERLEKGVLHARWENEHRRAESSRSKEQELQKAIHQLNLEMEKLGFEIQQAKEHLNEGERVFRLRSEEVYRIRSEKEYKLKEKNSSQERIKEAAGKEKKLRQELEEMLFRREKRKKEFEEAVKQQKGFETELGAQSETLSASRKNVQELEKKVVALRDKQQAHQRELMQLVHQEGQIESEYKQNGIRLEANQERKIKLQERLERVLKGQGELVRTADEKQSHLKEISHAVDLQKARLNSLEKIVQELQKQIQEGEAALHAWQREWTELKARQKVLLKLRDEMEGFSPGAKKLMKELKVKGLYEFIQPLKGQEEALSVFLRPYAQTLVVQTEKELQEVLSFAEKHKLKDFSLFCTACIKEKELPEQTLAEDSPLARHFLGGSAAAGQPGFLVDFKGVFYSLGSSENTIFMREAELKALEGNLQELESSREGIEAALKGAQEERSRKYSERVEVDKALRKTEMSLVEANFALQKAKGDQEKLKNELAEIEREIASLTEANAKLNAHSQGLLSKFEDAKRLSSEKKSVSGTIQEDIEKDNTLLKQAKAILQEKESVVQRLSDDSRKAQHLLHVIEVKDSESLSQEKRVEEDIQASLVLQQEMRNLSDRSEKALGDVEKQLGEMVKTCTELEQEVLKRKAKIEALDARLQETKMRSKKVEGDLAQTLSHTTHLEEAQAKFDEELKERYQLSVLEVQGTELVLDRPLDQAEKALRALRAEIDSAGDVNMTSIEAYEEHQVRYQFLNQQLDDLTTSKEELIKIITDLDGESRKLFKETFEQIRANFVKNFRILFNGGEADLQFTESTDVLEAGVDISAKPPGKQMRSIHLLSGGEKCLTAMALLFAIFEVKPAPYCILDEIDAPLDDTNVERFINVVKQFIDRCQFIVITHNKRTMAMADMLFGVSMEERGVSKMLSIAFKGN